MHGRVPLLHQQSNVAHAVVAATAYHNALLYAEETGPEALGGQPLGVRFQTFAVCWENQVSDRHGLQERQSFDNSFFTAYEAICLCILSFDDKSSIRLFVLRACRDDD